MVSRWLVKDKSHFSRWFETGKLWFDKIVDVDTLNFRCWRGEQVKKLF